MPGVAREKSCTGIYHAMLRGISPESDILLWLKRKKLQKKGSMGSVLQLPFLLSLLVVKNINGVANDKVLKLIRDTKNNNMTNFNN